MEKSSRKSQKPKKKRNSRRRKYSGHDCAYSWPWLMWYQLMENYETSLHWWLHLWKNVHLCHSYIHDFSAPHPSSPQNFVICHKIDDNTVVIPLTIFCSSTLNNIEGSYILKRTHPHTMHKNKLQMAERLKYTTGHHQTPRREHRQNTLWHQHHEYFLRSVSQSNRN